MLDTHNLNMVSYSPVGDIIVMALCFIMAILMLQTYISNNRNYKTVVLILAGIVFSSVTNILYQSLIISETLAPVPIYIFRIAHHILLTAVLFLYIKYLHEPLWIPHKTQKRYVFISAAVLGAAIILDITGTSMRLPYGFYITDNNIHRGINLFIIVYALFDATIFHMILRFRSRIIKQVFWGLLGVNLISVMILALQGTHDQVSYTVAAYFFPVLGIVFMLHSNPYDVETGAISGRFLVDALRSTTSHGGEMVLISCQISDFSKNIRLDKELRYEYYRFFRQNVKRGVLYSFPDERLVLSLTKEHGRDMEPLITKMLEDFNNSYQVFGLDYKIVIIQTSHDISSPEDYEKLISLAEKKMQLNSIHRISSLDISEYYNSSYILSQLEDIAAKKDPLDKRVLIYCQPVFNILSGNYDTAEALVRLELDKTGIVMPGQFIGLAEENGLIHQLSMIILQKTCYAIRDLMEEGFEIRRISVNFSVLELQQESFFTDVKQAIDRNGIPYSKIAIEITESRSEAEFHIMKQRVTQLQELGIMFYLDDFGTGYSNFERIMEIPFDIIKFDRSLLIESRKSSESHFMVSTFASMFRKLDYAILFEGVENDMDEANCLSMNARYLQGYKYSKPIPIHQLRDFLNRVLI
ncbi:MAG: EAL domain-containing protein [Ruminococcus sp.]|nr:EAL domain-containing protein [Ruminococcus sp.]